MNSLSKLLTSLLLIASATAFAQSEEPGVTMSTDRIAPSADQIQPLLLGAAVPSVMVADMNGNPVNLKEVITGQPTILIFYRGGW